ncbi:MAG: tetratricopeptide repeat protein [Tannerella sp.]|nr:tetratricopeptide repeat protein [Tannerella sp.]
MEKCQRCGEVMPALSKVCSFCGHVNTDGVLLKDEIETLESYVLAAKRISSAPFRFYLKKISWIFHLLFTLQLFFLAAISLNTVVWIGVIVFFVLFIVAVVGQLREKAKQDTLQYAVSGYDDCRKKIVRYYGNDTDVKRNITGMDEEIEKCKTKNRTGRIKNYLMSLLCIALVLCVTGTVIFNLSKQIAYQDPEYAVEALSQYLSEKQYDKALQIYPQVESHSPDRGDGAKMQIINALMDAGEYDTAVSFFRAHCIGKHGDFRYAEMIVNALLQSGERNLAADFSESCTDMRYKSDYERLIRLSTK